MFISRPTDMKLLFAVQCLAVLCLGFAQMASAQLVINEIDYDQPSTDTAEFIEIKNISAAPVDLDPFTLELVNGSGGGASVYNTIDLPLVSLAPGDYFVVCGDPANVANCDLDASPDSNLVQNGGPDAVALMLGASLIDTVSYEGDTAAPFTEGSGAGLVDPSAAGMGLSPLWPTAWTRIRTTSTSVFSRSPPARSMLVRRRSW